MGMSERDALIGRNVARLRGGRTQKELAEAMRERGHKWSQATVWSVEQGERPLRLTEADDLVQVLGHPFVTLSAPDSETLGWAMLRELRAAERDIEQATERYLDAQDQLAFGVSEDRITGRVAELIMEELKITPWRVARRKSDDLASEGSAEMDRSLKDLPEDARLAAEQERADPPEPFRVLRDSRGA
jgi:transcriptional regulator with XRE-family HTH domain